MGKVIVSFTMSLDGFIAGPNISPEDAMGEGGEQLHDWLFDGSSEIDRDMAREMPANVGAVILGKRTFDLGLPHWEDTPFPAPSFVLTHEKREPLKMKSSAFTFINGGVESAVQQAKAAAGEKDIVVMGANVAQQLLRAELADEIVLQLAPVLLGQRHPPVRRYWRQTIELKNTSSIESPLVTHLRFQVL